MAFTCSTYPWLLKGGYAMELRMHAARTAKDIDLTLYDGARLSMDPGEQREQIRALLQEFLVGEVPDHVTDLASVLPASCFIDPEICMHFRALQNTKLNLVLPTAYGAPAHFATLSGNRPVINRVSSPP